MTISSSTDSLITNQAVQNFSEHGYCVVPGLFSPDDIQKIQEFFEAFRRSGSTAFEGGRKYEDVDPTQIQVRAMQPHRYDRKAEEWLLHPNVAAVLKVLLGRPALAAQSMYYFKPPGAKGQGMHQDNFYLVAQPATCIAAWTAIDDADLENGCLYVVPGSHREDILCPSEKSKDRWFDYGDSHIGHFPREQKPVPVPVPRGSTMFFSGNLIHGSGPNQTTDRWRRTFIGHYIDEASEQVSRYYHPVLNMSGEVVSSVNEYSGGGPCADGWMGGTH